MLGLPCPRRLWARPQVLQSEPRVGWVYLRRFYPCPSVFLSVLVVCLCSLVSLRVFACLCCF